MAGKALEIEIRSTPGQYLALLLTYLIALQTCKVATSLNLAQQKNGDTDEYFSVYIANPWALETGAHRGSI